MPKYGDGNWGGSIMDTHAPSNIFFGTTCDNLKMQMGMTFNESFKVGGVRQ